MLLPGRTSVDRCLVRHGLITPQPRRRKRSDYKRWERSRAVELWQLDIVGGVRLADGSQAKIVSGIDDHSRFVVCAKVVARATALPVCEALELALAHHGVPEAILTDNGKVFTARFGPGPGPVRFDRICTEQGIKHLLTAPRAPTTTGKVERWHKTLRAEFLTGKVFTDLADAQAQLDTWVHGYNHDRPHQAIGRVAPFERFRLAEPTPGHRADHAADGPGRRAGDDPAGVSQGDDLVRHGHLQGRHVAGRADRGGGLRRWPGAAVPRGVLVATHARRHQPPTSRPPGWPGAGRCAGHRRPLPRRR